MMDIFLHIGIPKTGNQYLINTIGSQENSETRKNSGLAFFNGYYNIMSHVRDDEDPRMVIDKIRSTFPILERLKADKLLIISEALSGSISDTIECDREKIVERLKKAFDGHRVHISMCLRRQDKWIESMYVQYIKEGGVREFQYWLDDFYDEIIRYCDYKNLISSFSVFDSINVIPYEMHRNPEEWISAVFSQCISGGISFTRDVYNNGIGNVGAALLRTLNRITHKIDMDNMRKIIQINFPRMPGEPFCLLDSSMRLKVIGDFSKINSQLPFGKNMLEYYTSSSDIYNTISSELAFTLDEAHKNLDIAQEGRR